MATDYSQEIKDLQSINSLAIDLGKRLVIQNAPVDGLKALGQTELWIIQETATRLAADLTGYTAPVGEGEDEVWSLSKEQNKLFKRE